MVNDYGQLSVTALTHRHAAIHTSRMLARNLERLVNIAVALSVATPSALHAQTPRDSLAIASRAVVDAAKNAVIVRADGKRSSVNVAAAIHWHEWTGRFAPGDWTAQRQSSADWIVQLSDRAGKKKVVARWSYNTENKTLSALDPLAAELAFRHVPTLECALAAEARLATFPDSGLATPPTFIQMAVLPVPRPEADRRYAMHAEFAVDAMGNGEVLEWTRPSDAKYAERVALSLQKNTFRPARDHDGNPVCGRTTLRIGFAR